MFRTLFSILFGLSFVAPFALASFEGLDLDKLSEMAISSHSRPCCNFAVSYATDILGISKLTSFDQLGQHQFLGGKKENNGITFTCKGGFIDTAHLRDTADWTVQLMWSLPLTIGSGDTLLVEKDNAGDKTLVFPKLSIRDISKLTMTDYAEISERIVYEIAVWHEIATGLEVHVSSKYAKETSSSFSIEDNYSNLMGAYIGMRAILHDLPYEEAMTQIISSEMTRLEAQPYANVEKAFNSVRDVWWKKKIFPNKYVSIKKNMDTYDIVKPSKIPNAESFGCTKDTRLLPITVPRSSNLFTLKIKPSREVRKKIEKILGHEADEITSADFPSLIFGIKGRFSKYLGDYTVN